MNHIGLGVSIDGSEPRYRGDLFEDVETSSTDPPFDPVEALIAKGLDVITERGNEMNVVPVLSQGTCKRKPVVVEDPVPMGHEHDLGHALRGAVREPRLEHQYRPQRVLVIASPRQVLAPHSFDRGRMEISLLR